MTCEYTPVRSLWPRGDTVITAFRYILTANLVENKKVLELGCGTGEGMELLAKKVRKYVGLDIEARWQQNAAAQSDNVTFVQCSACDLPEEWVDTFEVIIALELVEHLNNADAFLQSIKKVLIPQGIAIISTPNFDILSRCCDNSRKPLYEHHCREFTAEEFNEYLKGFGTDFFLAGLSQLAPQSEEPDAYRIVLDDRLYHLSIVSSYPAIEVTRVEKLQEKIPLQFSQCFFAVVGKNDASLLLPKTEIQSSLSTNAVCARSIEWILRRRNEHIRELQGVLTNKDAHIEKLEGSIAALKEHIASLEAHVKNLEKIMATLKAHSKNLEEIVEIRDKQITSLQEQISQLGGPNRPNDKNALNK